jgi:hypothetical protein
MAHGERRNLKAEVGKVPFPQALRCNVSASERHLLRLGQHVAYSNLLLVPSLPHLASWVGASRTINCWRGVTVRSSLLQGLRFER